MLVNNLKTPQSCGVFSFSLTSYEQRINLSIKLADMGLFSSDIKINYDFSTRSDAFKFMITYLTNEKGMDPLEASEAADKFAEVYAKNLGIPEHPAPELKGVDKYISIAEKIGNYLEAHPKVIDYGIPAITFLAGLFTGKKVEEETKPEYHSVREAFNSPIKPDEIED